MSHQAVDPWRSEDTYQCCRSKLRALESQEIRFTIQFSGTGQDPLEDPCNSDSEILDIESSVIRDNKILGYSRKYWIIVDFQRHFCQEINLCVQRRSVAKTLPHLPFHKVGEREGSLFSVLLTFTCEKLG